MAEKKTQNQKNHLFLIVFRKLKQQVRRQNTEILPGSPKENKLVMENWQLTFPL